MRRLIIKVFLIFFVLIQSYKLFSVDYQKEYNTKRINSDFGSLRGVNGGRRSAAHQGIDIIGPKDQQIIAIADGVVLETTIEKCWGPTVVIDHGKSFDGKNLITLYGHVGDFLVKKNDKVKRGDLIAKLPKNISAKYRCMVGVRHLHLQIGQTFRKQNERKKSNWGWVFFLKDGRKSLNPHLYWANGKNKVTCFDNDLVFPEGTITYPFPCKKK